METHVERVNRTKVYEGSILDVYQDDMMLPDGSVEKWDFVSHRDGAAAIVPVLPDGRILLVRQYRPSLERYTWELPAGKRDNPEESTAECAVRELFEETGYTSDDFSQLLSLRTTVAFCDELVDIYLALDCYEAGKQKLDPSEQITIKAWDVDAAIEHIFSYEFQDSKTVAGILAYKSLRLSWGV